MFPIQGKDKDHFTAHLPLYVEYEDPEQDGERYHLPAHLPLYVEHEDAGGAGTSDDAGGAGTSDDAGGAGTSDDAGVSGTSENAGGAGTVDNSKEIIPLPSICFGLCEPNANPVNIAENEQGAQELTPQEGGLEADNSISPTGFSSYPARLLGKQLVKTHTDLEDLDPAIYGRHLLPPGTSVLRMLLPEGTYQASEPDRWKRHPELMVLMGDLCIESSQRWNDMESLVESYRHVFAWKLEDIGGYKGLVPPPVILQKANMVARQKPRPVSYMEQYIQDVALGPMVKAGWVERAPNSLWAANPVFAFKKDSEGKPHDVRVCYDYRLQNQCSESVHTNYPVGEELFQQLGPSCFFSRVDLRQGFWQLPLAEESRDKAAFWWKNDLYRPTRVVFGLKQAPAWFQHVMEVELGNAGLHRCCKIFIDDVLIHSESWEQHLRDVEAVFRVMESAGLMLHPEKSAFGASIIEFLGFNVSNYGLTPQEAKVKAFADLPPPKGVPDLQTVLGKLRYYACFVHHFSSKAQPMVVLLRKDTPWNWSSECQAAFDLLKKEIATPGRALRRFNQDLPIIVYTDFSNTGLGAVLAQTDTDGMDCIVACISRSLNKHERNYSAFKGEMLAAVWAVRTLSVYIMGRHITLVTDHRALVYLLTTNNLSGVLARWAVLLHAHDITVVHRAGSTNANADVLSRFPLPSTADSSGARMDDDYEERACLMMHTTSSPGHPLSLAVLDYKPQPRLTRYAMISGVVLLELCGGICAGLEACLRNGIVIQRYLYSDISPTAQQVARHRIQDLRERFPLLLQEQAVRDSFSSLPMDIHRISVEHLEALCPAPEPHSHRAQHAQWLVIAGPECQDFSPAGHSKGLDGTRAQTFKQVLQIVAWLQSIDPSVPPLYIVENAAMQHNWKSKDIRDTVFPLLCRSMGPPVCLDAVLAGSYAHRLRNYWTNLADSSAIMSALQQLRVPKDRLAQDMLDPGRFVSDVSAPDRAPYAVANLLGEPRRAFPTLVAYPGSRAFREGRPGAVLDLHKGTWTEPNPDERERILGYRTGATAAPGVSDQERHRLTGNAIDQAALSALIRLCLLQSARGTPPLAYHPVWPQVKPPPPFSPNPLLVHMCQVFATSPHGLGEDAAVIEHADIEVERISPALQREINIHEKSLEDNTSDILDDALTLYYVQHGSMPNDKTYTDKVIRRVTGRARFYHFNNEILYRVLKNGQRRVVPSKEDRVQLIREFHATAGHFGFRRTLYLLMAVYSWRYMRRQVKAVLLSCMPCQQAHARFKNTTTTLTPHPVVGMFFTWGVDLSGPYPKSERGYSYLFHAVEHHIHLMVTVPITDKTSATVAFAFLQHIIGQYGACAQVVTDSGSEFKADFDELLLRLRVDHRVFSVNNPQANGLTERAVGTLKRAMSKRVDETGAQDWDIHAIYTTLAYNLTPQESTKVAPFHALYGREPQFPSSTTPLPVLDSTGQNWLSTLQHQAAYFQHMMPTLANHLAVSKHRDTLRYTYTRSGAYRPQHLQFKAGDYVFVAQNQPHSKLELPARPFILRLLSLTPTGTAEVEGRCGTKHKTHIRNLAPCHLPCIDGRTLPELARPSKDLPCKVCHLPNQPSKMLLCDRCNKGFHTFCLQPPLTSIPFGNWFCPACVPHVDDVHFAPEGLQQQLSTEKTTRQTRRKTLKRKLKRHG